MSIPTDKNPAQDSFANLWGKNQDEQNNPLSKAGGGGGSGPVNLEDVDDLSVDDNNPYDPQSIAYDPGLESKDRHTGVDGKEVSPDTIQPYTPPDDKYV